MTRSPTWIFFDCFNTLVDDFDGAGSETGLEPIAHLPVVAGLYTAAADFLRDYAAWRRQWWAGGDWSETPLPQRLWAVLLARAPGRARDVAHTVDKMMAAFGPGYRTLLRPTPGVEAMLRRWQGVVEMGMEGTGTTTQIHPPSSARGVMDMILGVAIILRYGNHNLFEIQKRSKWMRQPDGQMDKGNAPPFPQERA